MTPPQPLRLLVACPACERQYDASGWSPGRRFRCSCGAEIVVPAPAAHDAAVVRCSSCGAPRLGGSARCTFCDADFTLHEQDLDTLCPSCLARISRRARFCHACATPIVVEEVAREATAHPCPSCGPERSLTSRRISSLELSVLECSLCAGLWVGRSTFQHLVERSRRGEPAVAVAVPPIVKRPQAGALYRRCPYCSTLMNRQNFERASGVILDTCPAHGLWFDSHELAGALEWVRRGGVRVAETRRREEAEALERARRVDQAAAERTGRLVTLQPSAPRSSGGLEVLAWLLEKGTSLFL